MRLVNVTSYGSEDVSDEDASDEDALCLTCSALVRVFIGRACLLLSMPLLPFAFGGENSRE